MSRRAKIVATLGPATSSLENTSVPTGTLPASNRMTNGDTVPVGMNARDRLT